MRKNFQKLRVHTDQSPSPPAPLGSSFNRTPPLDPPIAMASPVPSRGPSRSGTPLSDPRSSSRQSDPFTEDNGSPSKGSRFSRLKQSVRDSFAAGIDPEGFHEKRRREARAGGSPTSSNNNSRSMTPISRGNSRDTVPTSQPASRSMTPISRGNTMDIAPTSHPTSRDLSRTTTNQSTPSRPSALTRKVSKKDVLHHAKQVRKLDRQASQRQKVKLQRKFERGELAGAGSPRHAPLHLLEEANDARNRAEERRKLYESERRRSLEDRRQAYAPNRPKTPENRREALDTNSSGRDPTQTTRSSSQRRAPEYDKHRDKRPEAQAARDPEPAMESDSDSIEYTVPIAYHSPAADDPLQVPSSTYTSTRPGARDINPYHWGGIQPRTPSPSEYMDASVEEDNDPFTEPARQNWTSPSRQNQDKQIRSSSSSLYSQEDQPGPEHEYNPYEEWLTPQPLQIKKPNPESQQQPRGEHEMIINRMTMPDQEASRQERDTYYAHVTRRMRGPAGREFF